MNRVNLGNQITNGMQILSVGATTASRTLGRADKTLNNLSPEEQDNMYKMKADKIRDQIERYNTGGDSAFQHLSTDEITKYREVQADDIRKKIKKSEEDENQDIDKLMENSSSIPDYQNNSGQIKEIKTKMERDKQWFSDWYNTKIKGKSKISNQTKSEFLKHLKGEDENANV